MKRRRGIKGYWLIKRNNKYTLCKTPVKRGSYHITVYLIFHSPMKALIVYTYTNTKNGYYNSFCAKKWFV